MKGERAHVARVLEGEARAAWAVQCEIVLRDALTPEHTAQHGQSLHVAHLTVVFKPADRNRANNCDHASGP